MAQTADDVLLLALRFATDSGERTELDQALEMFGINRAELEAET
ncbi:hypothetical protein [Corynebacterium glaucum]|nr:hypothetical protein [Corynebacterium glaucum]